MTTMKVALPNSLKSFVDDQVTTRGYASSSEHVRDLIRKDRDRQRLRGLLLEGVESPPAGLFRPTPRLDSRNRRKVSGKPESFLN